MRRYTGLKKHKGIHTDITAGDFSGLRYTVTCQQVVWLRHVNFLVKNVLQLV